MEKRELVIIGAGPAGSSAAAMLAQSGVDVLLLEQQRFPRHKVCGEFLSPEAQQSLRRIGLYSVIDALSPALIDRAKFVSPVGLAVPIILPGRAWGISRFAFDTALAAAAEQNGAELRTGQTATEVTQLNEGYKVVLRAQGRQKFMIRARAVITACGRHSRPALPPRSRSDREISVGLKQHYEGMSMPTQVELYFFTGGYVGVSPIEDGRINVCLLVSRSVLIQAGKTIDSMLRWAARQHPTLARRLSEGRPVPGTEAVVAPVDTHRSAAPWDGTACLGDTAVMIPPLCGDGLAMALRSAELCAPLAVDFLRDRLSLVAWETAYLVAWQTAFGRPVRVANYLQSALSQPILADICLGLGRLVPRLASRLVRATRAG